VENMGWFYSWHTQLFNKSLKVAGLFLICKELAEKLLCFSARVGLAGNKPALQVVPDGELLVGKKQTSKREESTCLPAFHLLTFQSAGE